MKNLSAYLKTEKWSADMGGVYSLSDLRNLLNETNPVSLFRRIKPLEQEGVLRRFIRGYYVCRSFNPYVLCSRIYPKSYLSLTTVLAQELMIGQVPSRTIYAVKTGKKRVFSSIGYTLLYFGITPGLLFGYEGKKGIRTATPEKAFLDTLYFYQKGAPFTFDIYQDLDISKLNRTTILSMLERYKNPRFVSFAKGYLDGIDL